MKLKNIAVLALAGTMAASVVLAGCGNRIDQKAVAAKLGDKEITLGLANFMAQYQAVNYDSYYMSYYGKDMWTKDVAGNGSTMTDQVKSSVMDQLETDYLLEQHMKDYKVEITDKELSAMKDAAKQFMADNSKKTINSMGATEENLTEMLRLSLIQKKMQNAIEAEVDTNVSDAEAAQRTFSYINVTQDGYYDANNKLVAYTDEEKKALPDKVKEMAAAAKTDFDGTATKNGYKVSTYSYGSDTTNDTMDKAVLTAASALKAGEISDLITLADNKGYYIIRLDSEFDRAATDKKKESIVSQRKSDHYTEVTTAYKKDVKWTVEKDAWAKVNFDELYTIKKNDNTELSEGQGAAATDGTAVNTEAVTGTETPQSTK